MAHFAELDTNNVVLRVIVVDNKDTLDSNNVENEQVGIQFCQNLLGGVWKQTSYNGNFRKNYASIGYLYDEQRDAFIPPKPFASWILDESTCQWMAPTPMPTNGNGYTWNENNQAWEVINGS